MKVLVIGGGGREHALVWGFVHSASVAEVFAAPGNPGIESLARCLAVAVKDPAAIADAADDQHLHPRLAPCERIILGSRFG